MVAAVREYQVREGRVGVVLVEHQDAKRLQLRAQTVRPSDAVRGGVHATSCTKAFREASSAVLTSRTAPARRPAWEDSANRAPGNPPVWPAAPSVHSSILLRRSQD